MSHGEEQEEEEEEPGDSEELLEEEEELEVWIRSKGNFPTETNKPVIPVGPDNVPHQLQVK